MLYRHVFDKISSAFHGILHVFVNFVEFRRLPEFRSSTIAQNIRSPDSLTMQIQLVYIFNNPKSISTTAAISKCESKAVKILLSRYIKDIYFQQQSMISVKHQKENNSLYLLFNPKLGL